MKNFEKIVPVLASGLVVAGLGTADAFAADVDTQALDNTSITNETQPSETGNQSTEIKNVTPANTEQTETGGTTTEGVVNFNVDSNGDGTSDGILEVETTPPVETDSKTETSTTTNPDGSTTTTTTTTKTEESTTDITGTVNGGKGTPSEEETGKVNVEVGKDVDNVKNDDGSYDWIQLETNIKSKYGDTAKVEENEDGSHSITFEQSSKKDAPLSDSELSAVLGGVELTKNSDGDYTYTKDGAEVTVKVTEDNSTETTTTTWTVTVTETTKPSTPVTVKPDDSVTDSKESSVSVTDILNKVQSEELTDVTKDNDGKVTKVVDGNKTYEFTYDTKEPKKVDIGGLSDAELNALLPSEGTYEKKDGKIFQTIGNVVRELTFNSDEQTLTVTEYTISVTVTEKSESDTPTYTYTDAEGNPVNDEQAVKDSVTIKSVVDAVMQAIATDKLNYDAAYVESVAQSNEDGTWTVTVGIGEGADHKTYAYTVRATISEGEGSFDIERVPEEHKGDVVNGSGSTTTITGNAYVSDEKVVWTENKGSSTTFIGNDGKVNVKQGDTIGVTETVSSVTSTEDGATVVTTYTNADGKTVTKTYTFLYNQQVTDEEKAALLGANQTGDSYNLKKTTWTVKEETATTETTNKNETIFVGNGLTQINGQYTYKDGNKDIVFDKDSTTKTETVKGEDGTTTTTIYTIEETDIPLANLTDEQATDLKSKIAQKYNYTDVNIAADGTITAKDANGKTVTVTLTGGYKVLTVNKTVNTSKDENLAFTDNNQAETKNRLVQAIKEKVIDAAKNGGTVYITLDGKEYALSVDATDNTLHGLDPGSLTEKITEGELITWIEKNTVINFDAMSDTELKKFLTDAKENGTASEMGHYHLELLIGSTLKNEATGKDEDCAVLGSGLKVEVSKTVDGIVDEDGERHHALLKDKIDYDNQSGGYYQFARNENEALRDDRSDYWGDGQENSGTSEYNFYKVTGQVAHNLVTGKVTVTLKWQGWYEYEHTENIDASGRISNKQVADAVLAQIRETYKDAQLVSFKNGNQTFYKVYREVANLEAYGYLDNASNKCTWDNGNHRGFDLQLSNLTLLKDGKVTASGADTYSYSAKLTTKTTSTTEVGSGASLTVGSLTTNTSTTVNGTGGSEITGRYEITETKEVTETKDGVDVNKYTGTGTGSYDSYKTYVTTEQTGTATGTQYGGSLSYTYEVPGTPEVTVKGTTQTNRDVNVKLDNTSVTTTTTTSTTTPTRGGDRTPTTPTPPVVDIPEEEPPLVDIPEEEPPLVDVPEEEPPLVDVPEEEPPLVDIPDTQPPKVTIPAQKVPLVKAPTPNTVEILEEDVPLAEVPETGESPMGLLAAAAACFSALGLGLLKKKHED